MNTPKPAAQQSGVSALCNLIVRDICETDPADPESVDSVCINVNALADIISMRLKDDALQSVWAGQQGDGLTPIEQEALEGLIMVAYHAWSLADNTEETDTGHNVDATDYQQLSEALDRLDALPDDQPGYTMSEAAKARWALRRLLPATQPPAGKEEWS